MTNFLCAEKVTRSEWCFSLTAQSEQLKSILPPDNTWIIGFNREGKDVSKIYSDASVIELFLHEYGHIVFFTNPSIEKDFTKTFWSSKKKTSDFITTYASSNATEDLAETFVYFVTSNRPTQEGLKFDKIRFLYTYKELTKLRDQLRESTYF